MQVIWKRLFIEATLSDKGTLYQLKVLLNRKAIPNQPKQNMKACEDFLFIILSALVKVAAEDILKSEPATNVSVTDLATSIVDKFVDIGTNKKAVDDDLYVYTRELLTLALIWLNYYDSTKEGDGDRIILLWKFLFVIFKKARRKHYSKEAFILLVHFNFLLSDRLTQQLKWSRFVNTRGQIGCNMPCDLYNEHLNRQLKSVLRNLRSNLQKNTIDRAAKSLGVIHLIDQQFCDELHVTAMVDPVIIGTSPNRAGADLEGSFSCSGRLSSFLRIILIAGTYK